MKQNNIIQEKLFAFAIRIVNPYKYLCEEKKEFVLSKQLLRSGTSVGANVEEALGAHSRKDFHAKLSVAYKEARETHYWLRLLHDTGFLDKQMRNALLSDCETLLKIIGSIIKSLKNVDSNNSLIPNS
jgi:four helix bundle protein